MIRVAIGDPEQAGSAELGISCSAAFGAFDEAKSRAFAERWPDRVALDAEALEVVEGAWQATVLGAAVVAELDLEPVEYAAAAERQGCH